MVRQEAPLALATSGYRPPPVCNPSRRTHGARARSRTSPGARASGLAGWDANKNWHVTPDKSVLNYSYVTPDYVLGTAELNPADTHIAPSSQNRWQGIIFATGPGDRIYPQAAPTSVNKTMDAFISVQNRNVLITRKQGYETSRRWSTSRRPSTASTSSTDGCS